MFIKFYLSLSRVSFPLNYPLVSLDLWNDSLELFDVFWSFFWRCLNFSLKFWRFESWVQQFWMINLNSFHNVFWRFEIYLKSNYSFVLNFESLKINTIISNLWKFFVSDKLEFVQNHICRFESWKKYLKSVILRIILFGFLNFESESFGVSFWNSLKLSKLK
jgi:hypothetical protein